MKEWLKRDGSRMMGWCFCTIGFYDIFTSIFHGDSVQLMSGLGFLVIGLLMVVALCRYR